MFSISFALLQHWHSIEETRGLYLSHNSTANDYRYLIPIDGGVPAYLVSFLLFGVIASVAGVCS